MAMQMTLAEAQAEYAETQKKLLRLEGYITALKEMAEGAASAAPVLNPDVVRHWDPDKRRPAPAEAV